MSHDDPFADQPTVPRTAMTVPAACRFVLRIVEGQATGAVFEVDALQPAPLLIGKSEVCEVRLADPMVSRRHASVEVVGERLRLRDLGSLNGTHVDGMAIVEAFIVGTKIIHVGSTTLRAERGDPRPIGAASSQARFGNFLGSSSAMRRLYPLCERLAAADVPVVIEGETGVGKEQLAESLHLKGRRSKAPFVVFDCTAVAPNLIESELFGHERGAFTGSVRERVGVFERAHGGTLLIDEIGDLPLELQAKLLRAIERLSITRVGGDRPVQVDVRILAATRRDLDHEIQLGRFRDDLFHRLAVTRIALPPLRERHGDVSLLARSFWSEMGGDPRAIPESLLQSWEDYGWPGNVRELRNAVLRRLALGDLASAETDAFAGSQSTESLAVRAVHRVAPGGDPIAAVLGLALPLSEARQRVVDELEHRYVVHVLQLHGGNAARAAAAAGVAHRHFRRLKARVMRQTDEDDDPGGAGD
jgi:transcriptional regulator with GAF, ATPase, and Fis domain